MENWKKALVVVAFLATIGGLVATQYLQARVNMELKLSERTADVQFIAYDLSPAGNYVLKNDTSALKVSLGTFCWHYRATYTAAFAIAWVRSSGNGLKITKIEILDTTGNPDNNVPVKIYLHQNSTYPSESGWYTTTEAAACTKLYYDGTSGGPQTVADPWVLEPISGVDYSTGTLMANTKNSAGGGSKTFTATWTQPSGEGYIWVSDDAAGGTNVNASYLQTASTYTNAGGCNFVWVEIVIAPSSPPASPQDFTGYTIIIYVDLVSNVNV